MFGRKTSSQAVLDGNDAVETQLWSPEQATCGANPLAVVPVQCGHITEEELAQVRTVQSQTPGKSSAQILQTMNAASEGQILAALATTLGLAFECLQRCRSAPMRSTSCG